MKIRYFKHRDKFIDGTLYLILKGDRLFSVDAKGEEIQCPVYNDKVFCEHCVVHGYWVEITKKEAKEIKKAKDPQEQVLEAIEAALMYYDRMADDAQSGKSAEKYWSKWRGFLELERKIKNGEYIIYAK